ncbi:MAG: rhodanese-like domain-containing protein [Sulfitobacter sp.]
MSRLTAACAALSCLVGGSVLAQDTAKEAKASFIFDGERVQIERDNPNVARFAAHFSASGETCGAPCIAPMVVADGVVTLGETDVLQFLMTEVAGNKGLMVDARMPEDRAGGYIPGSVSLPFATLDAKNEFKNDILRALGAREFDGIFNYTDARELLVYDKGPSSDDAGRLVKNLLAEGYPKEKIRYYRGGMQVWSVLGFSIAEGTS